MGCGADTITGGAGTSLGADWAMVGGGIATGGAAITRARACGGTARGGAGINVGDGTATGGAAAIRGVACVIDGGGTSIGPAGTIRAGA